MNTQVFFFMLALLSFTLAYPHLEKNVGDVKPKTGRVKRAAMIILGAFAASAAIQGTSTKVPMPVKNSGPIHKVKHAASLAKNKLLDLAGLPGIGRVLTVAKAAGKVGDMVGLPKPKLWVQIERIKTVANSYAGKKVLHLIGIPGVGKLANAAGALMNVKEKLKIKKRE
jgi:hypothetical protein